MGFLRLGTHLINFDYVLNKSLSQTCTAAQHSLAYSAFVRKGVILSNWFESNPTKSILIYTFFVAGFTWGVSNFILDENRVNLYKAQVENEQALNRQFNAKIGVLESRIIELSNENKRLYDWVAKEPGSFPALSKEIEALEHQLASEREVTESNAPNGLNENKTDVSYSYSESFVIGQSFTDPLTNATIGVSNVSIQRTADVYLHLPGSSGVEVNSVKPGSSWVYSYKNKTYKLTLNTIEWIGSQLQATVVEISE